MVKIIIWFPKVIPKHVFIGWLRVHNGFSTKDRMFSDMLILLLSVLFVQEELKVWTTYLWLFFLDEDMVNHNELPPKAQSSIGWLCSTMRNHLCLDWHTVCHIWL